MVELIDPAIDLLRQIVKGAEGALADEIKVTQRDNVSTRTETVHFLFRSSTSGLLWNGKSMSTWFTAHLKKAGAPVGAQWHHHGEEVLRPLDSEGHQKHGGSRFGNDGL